MVGLDFNMKINIQDIKRFLFNRLVYLFL